MKPSDLSPLISRIGEAKGPDREIDFALLAEFDPERAAYFERELEESLAKTDPALVQHRGKETFRRHAWFDTPRFTGSLDAALALVERKLPDHHIMVSSFFDDEDGRHGAAELRSQLVYGSKLVCDVRAATPALALCVALLRALEASADAG